MNSEEARQILTLFRPGTADEQDAAFVRARELVKTDVELARWFDDHCASYLALRRKFHEISVPTGLREQILSERKIDRTFLQRYWGPLLAAAAVVMLLLGLEAGSWLPQGPANHHSGYVKNMAGVALGLYSMELETNNPVQVQAFLAKKHGPADYSLPAGLKQAEMAGCLVSVWQGNRISMICFKTGRPLEPGRKSDLWLFIADRTAVPDAPLPGSPAVFEKVDNATMASWSDANKTYVLAAVADQALLGKFLE